MKSFNRYLAMVACGGSLALAAHAEKVKMEELPGPLRDQIKIQTGGARVEDIDRTTRNGQTYYEVAFKRDGQNAELTFDQNGRLQNAGEHSPESRKVTIAEMSPAARRVVENRLQGAQPNDIDRHVTNGRIAYEVGFKRNGRQQEILVSEGGRILRDIDLSPGAMAAAQARIRQEAIPLSNKQKLPYEQLPTAVKASVGIAANGARIEDVERGEWRARTIYEIAFKDQGRNIELQIEENGRVLHDPRVAGAEAAGVPAANVTGGAASAYPGVTNSVALSGNTKIGRQAVPAAVEEAIERYAPGAKVEDIEHGTWRGLNVYQVAFQDQGRHVELQLDEKGNVIHDPRKK